MTLPKYLILYLGLGLFLIFLMLPEKIFISTPKDLSLCIHVRLLGIECPGCGFTRAIYHLFHLNFKQAISFNPTVIFAFPITVLEIIYFLNKADSVRKIKYFTYICFIIALFLLYLARIFNHFNS